MMNSTINAFREQDLGDFLSTIEINNSIIITDENVWHHYQQHLANFQAIVIPAGEEHKHLQTVQFIIDKIIDFQIDRKGLIIGLGGGVVTDIAGFIAGIYLRGVRCIQIPSSLLAMVDASVGGKNGVDVGHYKNMIGLIRQPELIVFDYQLLKTLPQEHWVNGFAEIIKHAAILDAPFFEELINKEFTEYQHQTDLCSALINKNIALKSQVVAADEFEKGLRRILNFGHTLGHAIEQDLNLLHGQAISIGMHFAAYLSEKKLGFKNRNSLKTLLSHYGLSTHIQFNVNRVMGNIFGDKKRENSIVHFVLLEEIGKSVVVPIKIENLAIYLHEFLALEN